ncbi:hypothetical protein [Tropicibacter sp. S64]|uniref:hypothetical protein n=1 Tax=Tropicibacter sp. S64 TaxID=3415122 RepID=UPI003C7986C8
MRLLSVLLVLLAGQASAQVIPLPFTDSAETRQISVTVTPDRRSMKGLSADLVRARTAMHQNAEVSDEALRRLADMGDGLAAQRYVRRLIAQGRAVTAASDVAYYSAIAVGAGRVWTLPDMIAAMTRLDPETESRDRIRLYIKVLYAHAWAGNTLALDAVVDFNGEGKLFGALSDRTRAKILAQGEENADGKVELRMAMVLLEQQDLSAEARNRAKGLLEQAAQSRHLGIMTTAENLLALMETKDAPGG